MPDQNTMPIPYPPDGPPPRSTHRPAVRAALIAALATLVLVLPVGLYLLLRTGSEPTRPAAPPATTGQTISPTPSATSSRPRVPDGRISLQTLKNATLVIPRWPSDNVRGPSGALRFRDGRVAVPFRTAPVGEPPVGSEIDILSVRYGDVDRDGADETIAEIGCLVEGGSKQLVAFDRDRSGHIVTLGRVVATTGAIRDLDPDSAGVASNGTVTVRVSDYQRCCGDETPQRWQTRGYRWHDGRFEQVSGPTVMIANPYVSETRIGAGALVLGPVVDGYRSGTVTITITHGWGTRPDHVRLRFFPPADLERTGTAWPPVTSDQVAFTVTLDPPRSGLSVTRTFAFRAPATSSGGELAVEVEGLNRGGQPMSEAVPWNNTAVASIRFAD